MQSMASVVLEGKCAPGGDDKVKYCEGQCEQYRTYDDKWNPCIAECTKKSAVKVTAAVKAVANIEIKSEEYCNGYDHLRTGETYLLHLQRRHHPRHPRLGAPPLPPRLRAFAQAALWLGSSRRVDIAES